jgi:hypothetical protein
MIATPPIVADPLEIRRALAMMLEPGQVAELRILHAGRDRTVAGYFDDVDRLAQAAAEWSGRTPGVYVTLNPVNPALLSRARNRVKSHAETLTSDHDILRRRWFPIDLDPVRPTGISSTDDEHAAALRLAEALRSALRADGWPDPIVADSGNGAHLLYPVDLPNDAGTTARVGRVLTALAWRFNTPQVHVDVKMGNAARIVKCYGTLASKGDSTPDRPHRIARILG